MTGVAPPRLRGAALLALMACSAQAVACSGPSETLLPGTVHTVADRGATMPAVAVDPTGGGAYVAWIQEDEEGYLRYARSVDGGRSFRSPRRLEPFGRGGTALVRLAAASGPEARIWAAWEGGRAVDGDRENPDRLALASLWPKGPAGRAHQSLVGFAPALDAAGGWLALAWLEEEALRVRIGRP